MDMCSTWDSRCMVTPHQQHIKVTPLHTALQCALLYRPSVETACMWNPSQLSTSQCKKHAGQKGTACTVSTA